MTAAEIVALLEQTFGPAITAKNLTALDPFVALSFAAAATSRLRLQTHILVLPYRNPFLVAKAVLSLDGSQCGRGCQ